jgi:hypothetical protein
MTKRPTSTCKERNIINDDDDDGSIFLMGGEILWRKKKKRTKIPSLARAVLPVVQVTTTSINDWQLKFLETIPAAKWKIFILQHDSGNKFENMYRIYA